MTRGNQYTILVWAWLHVYLSILLRETRARKKKLMLFQAYKKRDSKVTTGLFQSAPSNATAACALM